MIKSLDNGHVYKIQGVGVLDGFSVGTGVTVIIGWVGVGVFDGTGGRVAVGDGVGGKIVLVGPTIVGDRVGVGVTPVG